MRRTGLALAVACAASLQATLAAAATRAPGDEPPAVQALLEQGQRLESAADAQAPDPAWQAASLYCEAARLGSTEAQYRLGMMYAFGRGVPESRAYGAALFSLAGMQGHEAAAQMLETIQLASVQLPDCVLAAVAPQRPAPPAPDPQAEHAGPQPIDLLVQSLPGHKQWVVPLATTLSQWYALDTRLVLSIIAVESNFETTARSPKEAMGLMQLIPDTAERFNVRNAYNATQNLRGGMAYLRWLLSYYEGNVACVAAAYNAGEGRVDRYKGVPPYPETRAYVKKVMGLYGRARHAFDAGIAQRSSRPPKGVAARC